MGERIISEVKWFSNERGYGFVVDPKNINIEYFVHFSSIDMDGFKTLKPGQKVEFEVVKTDKGIQAMNVVLV